ncbi:MAG TPA: Twin-arginine translocation pathway signal [Hydrogenophaga sp.]|uniref:Bug family tripartite tricarboxylate transporter substrate binding protein n=1 Tax=Hydrogenophaga sp. TaxID=1904254 RepID=UPI000AD36F75|nr:Bug family tripartite tricarboxylate transporter substrate binding protein [Hydrogenophaga sp.]HAX19152.1 Twin-arginine translocation pathway signal [Hydrogenophaga sp.]HBU20657.1 Twin-arginine translocation pathway signal [Hydrogenophaga sp.]
MAGFGLAQAQTPTKILVGFPAGGGSDAVARILAERLQAELGDNVLVDNKPGAGGQLAAHALKVAPADGHTVFLSHDHSVSILPLTMKNPGFDPAKDFVPVAGFATFVNAVALSGGTPARDFKAWIDSVKGSGGKATMGIPAPASTPQFAVQVIGKQFGLDLVAAPYRGSAPMMGDMLGNIIPAGVGSVPDFIENHKAGKLRVVAVMGTQRQAALPDVPTFTELGIKGFEEVPYYGLFAPAGTPKAALDKLGAALQKVIVMPDVKDKLTAMGLTVGFMSGAELGKREVAYREVWAKIIKDSGYQPQ